MHKKDSEKVLFQKKIKVAARPYVALMLFFYDFGVYKLFNRFVWRTSSRDMIAIYKKNISKNHLEVACGTGYLLNKISYSINNIKLTLLDFSKGSLKWSAKILSKFSPRLIHRDIFLPVDSSVGRYDSIGCNYLFHCLPGSFQNQKGDVFDNLKDMLSSGGTLFGTTILGRDKNVSFLGKVVLRVFNTMGSFNNLNDDFYSFEKAIRKRFANVELYKIGNVVFFCAVKR